MLALVLQALLTVTPTQSESRQDFHAQVATPGESIALGQLGYVEVPSGDSNAQRGHLGITIQDDDSAGLGIGGVSDGSAAAHAGLRAGDRLLALDSHPTDNYGQLVELLGSRPAGTEVRLRVRRTLELALNGERRTTDGRLALGVTLGDSPGREPHAGLHVESVERGYPAPQSGMRADDTIVAIDGHELGRREDLIKVMGAIEKPRAIAIAVERDVRVTLGSAPGTVAGLMLDAQPRVLTLPEVRRFRQVTPPAGARQQEGSEAALHDELHELSKELQALRDELTELRRELQSLRDDRRRTR
jgi:S1-C subfamily serine protease